MMMSLVLAIGCRARATPSEDCESVFAWYANAIRIGYQSAIDALAPRYFACVLQEGAAADGSRLVAYLRAMEAAGESVRWETYDGRVKAHPLIVEAVQAVMARLATGPNEVARRVFLSSLVRDRANQEALLRHPILKREASRHSLHLLGFAADFAASGKKVSMRRFGEAVRDAVAARMGHRGQYLEVITEPYCVHLQVSPRRGASLVAEAVAQLRTAGVIVGTVPRGSVPPVSAYARPLQARR